MNGGGSFVVGERGCVRKRDGECKCVRACVTHGCKMMDRLADEDVSMPGAIDVCERY